MGAILEWAMVVVAVQECCGLWPALSRSYVALALFGPIVPVTWL
jgi:hypothetical protein